VATIEDRYWVERDGVKVRTDYKGERRYRVRYREVPQGPVKSRSFVRKVDAEQFKTSTEHSLLAGTYVDPALGRETFGAWWARLRATRTDLRSTTRARDDSYYRTHVEPTFGAVPLSRIDRAMIREWMAGLVASGLAPKTVRHAVALVTQTLGAAVEDRLLATNPGANLKGLPEVHQTEMRCLTPTEVAAIGATIDPRFGLWLRTATATGLRLGELAALRPERFDLMRRRVNVTETLVDVRGTISFGPPKTKAGRRTVPLTGPLVDELAEHLDGLAPGDLVFTAPNGGPMRASLFRRRIWQPACVAAEVGAMVRGDDGRTRYEGPRIHDCRHTAISWWIASGADVKQIAVWAGHVSVSSVLDRYGHLLPDREDAVMAALEALIAKGSAPKLAEVRELRG
jgi:integrase